MRLRVGWALFLALVPLQACTGEDPVSPPPDDGGPPAPTPDASASLEITISTTGTSLDADGYLLAVDGGAPRAVGIDETVMMSDMTPGNHVVILSGESLDCTIEGRPRRDVTVRSATAMSVAYSVRCATPLHGQIVFASRPAGDESLPFNIYRMDPDGSNRVLLRTSETDDTGPSVSPDGRRIYFSSNSDIWVMKSDGTLPRKLIGLGYDPRVSAAESHVAFWHAGGGFWSDVVVARADGGGGRIVAPDLYAMQPSWSPDGTRIVFSAAIETETGYHWDILQARADGSERVNLTNHPGGDTSPVWSPDGSRIAFLSSRDGAAWPRLDLFVMNADGSDQTLVTSGAVRQLGSWSADGSSLLITSPDLEIYRVSLEDGATVNLTNDPTMEDVDPAYSP